MSKAKRVPYFLPNKGTIMDKPAEFLRQDFFPYSRNMEFDDEWIRRRDGLTKFSTTALSGRILSMPTFRELDGTRHEIFCTPDRDWETQPAYP